jgi:hypothetical protein
MSGPGGVTSGGGLSGWTGWVEGAGVSGGGCVAMMVSPSRPPTRGMHRKLPLRLPPDVTLV